MIVKENQDEIHQYITDQANFKGNCEKVFMVQDRSEVEEVLIEANRLKIPVTVCGNHTSLTGASLPSGGWVIATDQLNQIIAIDEREKTAVVQPGVTLRELQLALQPLKLFFPPDPTEDSCFIGGMIGTNASGAKSFKYGATRCSVQELEIVLPTGKTVNVSRSDKTVNNVFSMSLGNGSSLSFAIPDDYRLPAVKNAAGYYLMPQMSPVDIFIGAEGTLGVVTKATLKLESLPLDYISMVVFFEGIDESFVFLDNIRELSRQNRNKAVREVEARAIEFFDKRSLNVLRHEFSDIPIEAEAAIWIEQECLDAKDYERLLGEWDKYLNDRNIALDKVWFCADASDRAKIVQMRHVLPVLVNSIIVSRGLTKLGTDVAVPDSVFKEFYHKVVQVVEDAKVDYVAFGHFGNSHLHLNMLPSGYDELQIAKDLYRQICNMAIEYGGTFSAEHGVGKSKVDFLEAMMKKENIELMNNIKLQFDPNNILGRGNLFK